MVFPQTTLGRISIASRQIDTHPGTKEKKTKLNNKQEALKKKKRQDR
jgi:hypothetical protein